MLLNLECITFFTLLTEAMQLDGQEYINQCYVAAFPYMKANESRNLIKSFEKMGKHENISDDRVKRDRETLRKLLKGKSILGIG